MNLATNISWPSNPIDKVEDFLNAHAYTHERRSSTEIVVEIEGKWNNMLVFFSFESAMQCLHISCLMNIETQIENKSKIFELLALINDNMWVGHFSYWTEQKMPVFRHSILCNNNVSLESQIVRIFEIAVKECERFYPIFNVVLNKGMEPSQALYPLLMETRGQA